MHPEDAAIPANPPPPASKKVDKKNRRGQSKVSSDEPESAPEVEYTGAYLRQLRDARGLSINELSERTRISRTVLLALEEERWDDMPNARVYVRGFVRCVARELGLDMDEVSKSYVPRWERWFQDQ